MVEQLAIAKNTERSSRRPGPFGPAWALLPNEQQPLVIDEDTPTNDAIERMVDNNFSQLPIQNDQSQIIGVFTWKSFSQRACELRNVRASIKPIELPVRETMEPARFIDPGMYIDTETDWGDIDYVLIGDDQNLLGVLCIADVFGRLNDFAESFVLLYEIEHEIRDLIRDVANDEILEELIETMQLPPNSPRPRELDEFTFRQYRSLICSKSNWPMFEPIFNTERELIDTDFFSINDLRNIVFHFRRSITPKDTDRLRRFLIKRRHDRELYSRRELSTRLEVV